MDETKQTTRREASPSERAFLAELDTKALRRIAKEAIRSHQDETFWLVNDEIARRRAGR